MKIGATHGCATALDAAARLPAVFRPRPFLFWVLAVVFALNAACNFLIALLLSLSVMVEPFNPATKGTVNSLRLLALAYIATGLLPAAMAALAVRQAIARREPQVRPCREGLVLRTISRLRGTVATFYVPWSDLVTAEVRGILGLKRVVVLSRVEPYEIRFSNFDFPLCRPRTVAAAIVALIRDEAAHEALPGWDRPPSP